MGIMNDATLIIYFLSIGKYFKELSDSDITVFLMEESKGGKLVAFTETEIEQVMSFYNLFVLAFCYPLFCPTR